MRSLTLALAFFCLLLPAGLAWAWPRGLDGGWSGTVVRGDAEEPVRVALRPDRTGFVLDLRLPGAAPLLARMVPSGRPGVFQVPAESGGLFSFFDRGEDATPLDGAPLIWSRETMDGLVAYRFVIMRDGDRELLRVALERAADGLEIAVERRYGRHEPERWQTTLEREG